MASKYTPQTLADLMGPAVEEQDTNVNRSGQRAFMQDVMAPFTPEGFVRGVEGNLQDYNSAITGYDQEGQPVPHVLRELQLLAPSSPRTVAAPAGRVILGSGITRRSVLKGLGATGLSIVAPKVKSVKPLLKVQPVKDGINFIIGDTPVGHLRGNDLSIGNSLDLQVNSPEDAMKLFRGFDFEEASQALKTKLPEGGIQLIKSKNGKDYLLRLNDGYDTYTTGRITQEGDKFLISEPSGLGEELQAKSLSEAVDLIREVNNIPKPAQLAKLNKILKDRKLSKEMSADEISIFDDQSNMGPVAGINYRAGKEGLEITLEDGKSEVVSLDSLGQYLDNNLFGHHIVTEFQDMANKFLFQNTKDVMKTIGKNVDDKIKKGLLKPMDQGKLELVTIDRGDNPLEVIRGITLNGEDRILATIQKTGENEFKLSTRSFSGTVDSRFKAFDMVRQLNGLFKKNDIPEIKKALGRNKLVLDTSGETPVIRDRKGNFKALINPAPKGKFAIQLEDGTETILNNTSDLVEYFGGESLI